MTAGDDIDYKPSFPGIIAPASASSAAAGSCVPLTSPSYTRYGQRVVGVYDVRPEATAGIREEYGVEVFVDLAELLRHPDVEIVDVATHPDARPALIREALAAGKHVLAQKPLAEDIHTAGQLVDEAEQLGLRLAVNQNGRWAPAWRVATLLVEQGAVGNVIAVTHLYDHHYGFTLGTVFDRIEHLVLYDYSVHWFDITRCWLEGKRATGVRSAREYRIPNRLPRAPRHGARGPLIEYEDGSSAFIRGIGGAATTRPNKPFWIHGAEGTIRGRVLGSGNTPGSEFVELERGGRGLGSSSTGRGTRRGSPEPSASSSVRSPKDASPTTPPGTTCSRSS